MNKIIRLWWIIVILMSILASCTPVTPEVPVITEEPPVTVTPVEPQSIENLVVILVVDSFTNEVEDTSSTESETCTLTPDGQGLSGGRGSSTIILGEPHGFYVYRDLVKQIVLSSTTYSQVAGGAQFSGAESLSLIDPGTGTSADLTFMKQADLFVDTATGNAVLVIAVDTNGFDFDDIFSNIPLAIQLVSSNIGRIENYTLPTPQSIVVNMSFVFVPCDPMVYINESLMQLNNELQLNLDVNPETPVQNINDSYDSSKENGDQYFYEYVNQPCQILPAEISPETCIAANPTWYSTAPSLLNRLNSFYGGNASLVEDAMYTAFITHLIYSPDDLKWDNDPFKRFEEENLSIPNNPAETGWLQELRAKSSELYSTAKDSNVIFVGSAGNFGHPYPFEPASWDFVLGVSSDGTPPENITPECRATIAPYSNCGEVKEVGVYFDTSTALIEGTSFAAPKLSARIALNLLTDPPPSLIGSCPMLLNTSIWNNQSYNCLP